MVTRITHEGPISAIDHDEFFAPVTTRKRTKRKTKIDRAIEELKTKIELMEIAIQTLRRIQARTKERSHA